MTILTSAHDQLSERPDMTGKTLDRRIPWIFYGVATLVGVVGIIAGFAFWGVIAAIVVTAALPVTSLFIEGSRKATDRLATTLVGLSFVLAVLPLISLMWTVISHGAPMLTPDFFTQDMRNVLGPGGGIFHALMGTIEITLLATLMSVPIGIFTAIYLIEYGDGTRVSSLVRFLVDVMTGIPSIVAGLFAYALLVIFYGPGVRSGFGGALALSVLMIPTVVRSTEEMLKLVPNELREAAYALGVPKWATIVKVVLPTALAGIVTGVTLAIARVIGETAPLLIIAGTTASANPNLFGPPEGGFGKDGNMATLPVFAYSAITSGGTPLFREANVERGWGAALVLLLIVVILNLVARLVSYFYSPKGER